MIRPVTILGLALIVVLAAALYQLKYEVRGLERVLAVAEADLNGEEETIRVLGAEWSFLNRPSRLQALSDRYLMLAPMTQPQLRALTDIPLRTAEPLPPGDEGEQVAAAVPADPSALEEIVRLPGRKPFRLPSVRGR
jgi:hypothetical protein